MQIPENTPENAELLKFIVNTRTKRVRIIQEYEEKRSKLKLLHWTRLKKFFDEKLEQKVASSLSVNDAAIVEEEVKVFKDVVIPEKNFPKVTIKSFSEDFYQKPVSNIAEPVFGSDPTKIWTHISTKLIPIVSPNRYNLQNNKLEILQFLAHDARRALEVYKREISNNQLTKLIPRCKRVSKDMLIFWKRHEKEERELRKKAEKDAIERMKLEEEEREKLRQTKKLQFLLTQTELYSHFVGKKLVREANSFDTHLITPLKPTEEITDFAAVTDDEINKIAERKARLALQAQAEKARSFDKNEYESSLHVNTVVSQPKMLTCQLKTYQLKGLNWLANLYEQGINGILADDMGLGKTVQSISLLAHLAEVHNIWGPFLVVSPASTLHNWQQEFVKFAPQLKAVPYWGSIKDRKTLRKFWSGNRLYSKDSLAHVVITSYQLIVSDQQYFQRMKWQYMILDEAHAIKSAATARWKTLLNFNCRNRLLLTGTPIQNSMAELWALLHFIMPTIFDSHEEFSSWFSKDIETHAVDKDKGKLNERQLQRLHAILKPFMLRRIKSEVEHELGEKIEKTIYCDLTQRQRRMYDSLDKTGMEELFNTNEFDENLMNIVMQFRKVCNHPQLFETADAKSPFLFAFPVYGKQDNAVHYSNRNIMSFVLPKIIWNFFLDCFLKLSSQNKLWVPGEFMSSLSKMIDYNTRELLVSIFQNPLAIKLRDNHKFINCERRKRFATPIPRFCNLAPETQFLGEDSSVLNNLLDISHSFALDNANLPRWYFHACEAPPIEIVCSCSSFAIKRSHTMFDHNTIQYILGLNSQNTFPDSYIEPISSRKLTNFGLKDGISHISVPNPRQLLFESGKLQQLDLLLSKLKMEDHRVLIYFQMTKMIDLMEEYLSFRHYSYLRLDGSSKISDRRDLVTDWQTRPDIFIFLLSTRAGGLGINLTAADTVIFYDSDWNPTGNLLIPDVFCVYIALNLVDQQAMDRAHRLGQTKQVTVYRMVTRGTIEERILERAMQKDEIQKVVIAKGTFAQDQLNSSPRHL